jgi:hypothetical protein
MNKKTLEKAIMLNKAIESYTLFLGTPSNIRENSWFWHLSDDSSAKTDIDKETRELIIKVLEQQTTKYKKELDEL